MRKPHKTSSDEKHQSRIRGIWYFLKNNQWLIIGILSFVTMLLGYLGIKTILHEQKQKEAWVLTAEEEQNILELFKQQKEQVKHPVTDPIYGALQLFAMDNSMVGKKSELPITFEIARFLAPIVVGWTAVMALFSIFSERLRIFKLRHLTHNHVIICGLGRKGFLFAEEFCNADKNRINKRNKLRVVVIEQNKDNSLIEKCWDIGATVLIGNATDQELLSDAGIRKAKYLISVCGDDGVNAEVAIHAQKLVKKNKKKHELSCFIHIIDPDLWYLLREREIGAENIKSFRLQLFNVFDSGVRILLDEYSVLTSCENTGYSPHFLVIGLGRMGANLVAHLARKRWQAMQNNPNVKKKIRITIIDKDAETKKRLLSLKYPRLKDVCNLATKQMDIHSHEFHQCKFLFDSHGSCDLTMVFVCLDDDSAGLTVALNLHHHVRDFMIPIVVRTTYDAGLATLLAGVDEQSGGFENLYAFGLMDRACTLEVLQKGTHEILAHAIHEDYIQCQKDLGYTAQTNSSMVSWDELTNDMKDSNKEQADHIDEKLKAVGCRIAQMTDWGEKLFKFTKTEIEILAKMEHERWYKERKQKGWKYDTVKNNEKKLNPNLKPWEELSEGTKEFNRETIKRLPFVLSRAGFRIFRSTREILARAIHDDYVLNQANQGLTPQTNKSMVPWYELKEDLRESNRKQADSVNVRLMKIGYRLVRTKDKNLEVTGFNFTPEEVGIMAEMEHNRWVKERKGAGWVSGPVKDIEKRINPYLIEWDKLPEDQKDYNRMNAIKLPEFLAKAGFYIIRLKEKAKLKTL